MRDEFDDLYPIFHAINRDYFCKAIQVSKVLWVKEKDGETPNENWRAYYRGDRTWGEIFLVDSPRTPRTHQRVWKSVFHEMLHQLIGKHDNDFKDIENAVQYYWRSELIHWKHLRGLCTILLDNIAMKINKGLLPPDTLEKFKTFPLYRLMMGDKSVKLCGPPAQNRAPAPQPTVAIPRIKTPVRPMVRPVRNLAYDLQDALLYSGTAAGLLFLLLMIIYA